MLFTQMRENVSNRSYQIRPKAWTCIVSVSFLRRQNCSGTKWISIDVSSSFSKRVMWRMHESNVNGEDNLMVSQRIFDNIDLHELPHIRVSRSERGICDLCMVFRQKLGLVDDE